MSCAGDAKLHPKLIALGMCPASHDGTCRDAFSVTGLMFLMRRALLLSGYTIYSNELFLTGVLRQSLQRDQHIIEAPPAAAAAAASGSASAAAAAVSTSPDSATAKKARGRPKKK